MRFGGFGIAAVGLFAVMIVLSSGVRADHNGTPTVTTDKLNYGPNETVYINGTGFPSTAQVTVNVTRPDGNVSSWDASTDGAGKFSTTYLLDGIKGKYLVLAKNGIHEANTFFYDGNRTIEQCKNDTNDDDEKNPCVWITGTINAGISAYTEGDSVAFRIWMDGLQSSSSHNVTLRYDSTKKTSGGVIVLGYDFLTHPDASEDVISQRCTDIPGPIGISTSECNALSTDDVAIPSDGFEFSSSLDTPNDALEGLAVADREDELPAADRKFVIFGGNFDGTGDGPGAISKVGDPDTDSDSQSEITLEFTVGSGTDAACEGSGNGEDCKVEIMFGGHLAKGTT